MAMLTTNLTRTEASGALLDAMCREDFVSFAMRAFAYIKGGTLLDLNWHIDAIAQQLARIEHGHCHRAIFNLPPRNLKSLLISVFWPAWMLGRNPRLNFIGVSYALGLSWKHAMDCRAIMQSDWYQRIFPGTRLSSRTAKGDFETTMGGGRLSTSIDGTLTGRGGDIIIIDDPIKPEEVNSDVARARVNDWFASTLASRLDDKRRGVIMLVMQRLHQYDLCGVLQAAGGWSTLALPSIAIADTTIPLTGGRVQHRREGDVLHPEREDRAELHRQKSLIGSQLFAAQHQQDPVPAEGNLVKAEYLISYDQPPAAGDGQIVQSWDTASKEGLQTDHTVCITAQIVGRQVYILNIWRKRVNFVDLNQAAIDLARHYRADVMLIEDAASGIGLIDRLRNEQPHGVVMPTPRKPVGDKKTRLASVTPMMERGELLLPSQAPWLGDFKAEVLAFPSGTKDDQVDALSQLLIWADAQNRDMSSNLAGPIMVEVLGDGRMHLTGHGISDGNWGRSGKYDGDPWAVA